MDIAAMKAEEDIFHELRAFLLDDVNVRFAFIFGSYARGKQDRRSDLDVAIYFKSPPSGIDLLGLINVLSDISGRDVDLVALNSASPLLRHQVMKYGLQLVVKDRDVYTLFRENTIADYDEYKYISGMNIYD